MAEKKTDKKTASATTKPLKEALNSWMKPLKRYNQQTAELFKDVTQRTSDWETLREWFPEYKYQDVEGVCKVVDLEEVKAQDYSLTPGRYVGVSIDIDKI